MPAQDLYFLLFCVCASAHVMTADFFLPSPDPESIPCRVPCQSRRSLEWPALLFFSFSLIYPHTSLSLYTLLCFTRLVSAWLPLESRAFSAAHSPQAGTASGEWLQGTRHGVLVKGQLLSLLGRSWRLLPEAGVCFGPCLPLKPNALWSVSIGIWGLLQCLQPWGEADLTNVVMESYNWMLSLQHPAWWIWLPWHKQNWLRAWQLAGVYGKCMHAH